MDQSFNPEITPAIEACPYLGLSDDPDTSSAFASPNNFCHRALPPEPVSLVHQTSHCLGPGYTDCPMLSRSPGPLTPALSLDGPAAPLPFVRLALGAFVAGLAILAVLYGVFWRGGLAGALPDSLDVTQLSTPDARTGTSVLEGAPPQTTLPAPFPPSATLSTTPIEDLEVSTAAPFEETLLTETVGVPPATESGCGAPPDWVTYIIQPNDTLFGLSLLLGVTVEDLQVANCLGSSTAIIAGQPLFVPFVPSIPPTATPVPVTTAPPKATVTEIPPSFTPPPSALPDPATLTPTSTITPPPASPTFSVTPSPSDLTAEPTPSTQGVRAPARWL